MTLSATRAFCIVAVAAILSSQLNANDTATENDEALAAPAALEAVADQRLAEILEGGTPETLDELRSLERHVQRVVARVLPSVVLVSSPGVSSGSSGVLVQRDGQSYVLCAAHTTLSAGRRMSIQMPDSSYLQGVTLGADHKKDLGLVRIEVNDESNDRRIPVVEIGTSANLERGHWVLMLGHPSGRKPGRTAPVRLGRVLGVSQSGFVITDCAMQGGDSGGPLLDMNGRVVGINSFCTPNLAVNVHGPIDAMLDQWTELLGGSVIETSSPDLNLMRILSAKSLSQSDSMREAFNSSVQGVDGSVVQVLVEDTVRVLGTAIAPDLIVTKYSELVASDVIGSRTCRQGEASWPYTILGHDLPSDLALLKLDGARLKPIVWHNETPLVGSFLASPGVENLPNGIGVLSAAPYQHTQPHIKFGAWFKNWFHGAPEIQSASDGGAARRAGLREGDVVVQLDDQRIENAQQLMSVLTERRVGDKVGVAVKREDQELRIDLTLGAYRGRERQGQEIVWGPLSDIRSGFETVLQHDTVLKPEQCGGPLIDLSGRAIGLNIARAGRVETLALPALEVQSLVASLLTASESAKPLNNDTPPTQSKADTVLMDLENRVLWTRPALEGTPRGHASSPVMKLANLGDEANRSGSETAIALQTFGTRGFVWREILYRRTRPTLLGRQTESPAGSHIRSEAR